MYIHISTIEHYMNMRKYLPNYDDEFGSIVKHHRKKMKMTLEEGAKGICSVSYLSKVENNLIKPSEKYIALLSERFQIKLTSNDSFEQENILDNIIESMLFNLPIDAFKYDEDYKSKLNYFGYLVYHKMYQEAKNILEDLILYIKNFNDLELQAFLYFVSLIFQIEGRLKDSFIALELIKKKNVHQKLDLLIQKDKLRISLMMNHHPYIQLHYEKMIQKLVYHGYYHLVNELKVYYFTYMNQFLNEAQLNKHLNDNLHISKENKAYLKAHFYYIHMRYESAYELMKNYTINDVRSYMLMLLILNRLNKKDELFKMINLSFEFTNHEKLLVTYLKTKYTVKQEELLEFLRYDVLKMNDLPDEKLLIDFWYQEGIDLLKQAGYYKDATQLAQNVYYKLNDISLNID